MSASAAADGAPDAPATEMARALGFEIAERLEALVAGGTPESIDLRSMPMTPDDRAGLESLLGRGEVTATIAGNGRTEIRETAFPGVWWLAHHDIHGTLLMEEIAVTDVPEILRADPVDMTRGAARLAADLSAPIAPETTNQKEPRDA